MRLNATIPARILRVNHGGERGAIQIYRLQIALARLTSPELLPFLRETLAHEEKHLAIFRGLMATRAAKPCRMMWIWSVGGTVLGGVTGLLGRRSILMCTEVVERAVHAHLSDQVAWLAESDTEMSQAIREIQQEELGHLAFAEREASAGSAFDSSVAEIIRHATEGLIWLSTRGDSRRLAETLRATG